MKTGICELNCVLESFGYFCQIIKFDPYNIEYTVSKLARF